MYRGHTGFTPFPTALASWPNSELFRIGGANTVTGIAISAGATRTGTGSGLIGGRNPSLSASYTFDTNILLSLADGGSPIIGFPYRWEPSSSNSTDTPIVRVSNTLGQCGGISLQVTHAGFIRAMFEDTEIAVVDTRGALLQSVWYYMEVRLFTNDTIQIWIDEAAGFSSAPAFNPVGTISDFSFNVAEVNDTNSIYGGNWEIEHAVLVDTFDSGDGVTDRLGDGRVSYREPDTEVVGQNTGYTRTGGADIEDALTAIDDDTSYYAADDAADLVIFSSADIMPYTPTEVFAVQVEQITKKNDIGAREIVSKIRSGATNFDSDPVSVTASYVLYRGVWTEDPDAVAAWDKTSVEASEFGMGIDS